MGVNRISTKRTRAGIRPTPKRSLRSSPVGVHLSPQPALPAPKEDRRTGVRPTIKRTLRALGGRRIVIEGFGRNSPAFVAITSGGKAPIGVCLGVWLSPGELRRFVETARKILK